MAARCKTALVAEPSGAERARLGEMAASWASPRVLQTEDGLEALRLVEDLLPDALLVSATLRPGDGVWLALTVARKPLTVRPAVVLMRLPGLMVPRSAELADCGVAVIDRPARPDALSDALARTDVANRRRLPEAIRRRRDELLDRLGVTGTRDAPAPKLRWLTPGWTRGPVRADTTALCPGGPPPRRQRPQGGTKHALCDRACVEARADRRAIQDLSRYDRRAAGKPTCGR